MRRLGYGLLAGAAATSALNAVTYLDMAVRGRPASRTPEQSVRRLADTAGIDLESGNRAEGLGALLGYLVGMGAGAAYGVLTRGRLPGPAGAVVLSGLALLLANGPMVAMRITDPREWSAEDWAADLVPHVAFGVVGAMTYRLLDRSCSRYESG